MSSSPPKLMQQLNEGLSQSLPDDESHKLHLKQLQLISQVRAQQQASMMADESKHNLLVNQGLVDTTAFPSVRSIFFEFFFSLKNMVFLLYFTYFLLLNVLKLCCDLIEPEFDPYDATVPDLA